MTAPTDQQLKAIATTLRAQADLIDPPGEVTVPTTGGLKDRGKFKLVRAEYFDTDCAEGEFLDKYKGRCTAYPAHYLDTNGQPKDKGGNNTGSHYDPNNVSVVGGILRSHCRIGKDGKAGGAAVQLTDATGRYLHQKHGRWEARMKADPVSGYKRATMLWPSSYKWNDGEIDWCEGHLIGLVSMFNHFPGSPKDQDEFKTSALMAEWHVYAVEWTPEGVSFFLDDKLVGTSKKVPTTSMFFNDQVETNIGGTQPTAKDDGYAFLDYVGQWSYVP